jgi:hypothetical protein
MAFVHGKGADVLVGKYDLSAYLTEATPSMTIETAETTTLGSSAKTYITGLNDGTISFSGLFDGGATAIDAIFVDIIDNDLTPVITIAQDGGLVFGASAILAQAKQTTYDLTIPVGDVVTLDGEFQVTGGIRQGVILANGTSLTSTTNGTAVDNAASTSIGATANLHVTANTRNANTTIKVQHSVDNSTWVDLITFTTVGATTITSESLSVAGTVNRYLRAQTTLSTGTGAISVVVAISRRNN